MVKEVWNARGKELLVAHALRGRRGGTRKAREQRVQIRMEARLEVNVEVDLKPAIVVACVKSHGASTVLSRRAPNFWLRS